MTRLREIYMPDWHPPDDGPTPTAAGPGEALVWTDLVETPIQSETGRAQVMETVRVELEGGLVVTATWHYEDSATPPCVFRVRPSPAKARPVPREVLALLNDTSRARAGRPSGQPERIEAIVLEARRQWVASGRPARRDAVARSLDRSDPDGTATSAYKRDVRAAGGWRAILERARPI